MIKYTKELLENAVKKCYSFNEVLKTVSSSKSNSVRKLLKNKIIFFNIDYSHFYTKKTKRKSNKKKHFKDVLIKNTNKVRTPTKILKTALIESGKSNFCENCKLKMWLDKEITLEIHHIDGDFTNNLINNLILVCPNCHQLLDKLNKKITNKKVRNKVIRVNKTKIVWPNPEEIQKLVWEKPTVSIAKELGVSDKAVDKFCKKHKINKPPRGYWLLNKNCRCE